MLLRYHALLSLGDSKEQAINFLAETSIASREKTHLILFM